MRLLEVFRFEVGYQLRRPWPWLAFAALLLFSLQTTRVGIVPVTLPEDFILNSPFIIASVTVISCLIWLLVASAVPGEAAARDVGTRMYPFVYTLPLSKAEYLGGRFLAAFVLHALILLGVQAGSLLAAYGPGVDRAIIGPFRPAAYLAAYALIALPNAFVATTVQFASALLSGRTMASYVGSAILVFFTFPVPLLLYFAAGEPDLALMADPIGMFAIMNQMMTEWTIVEKNIRMFTLEGAMLANRLLWLGIAATTIGLVYRRYRFEHRAVRDPWPWFPGRAAARVQVPDRPAPGPMAHHLPRVHPSFGAAGWLRQTLSIAGSSAHAITRSTAGLFLLLVYPAFVVLVLVVESQHWGIRLLPRTAYVLPEHITSPLTLATDYRAMVPLLIVYLAGELIWRERDAGINENVDATPVPEWALLLGKLLGLSLILALFLAVVAAAGMVAQLVLGYHDLDPGLYATILLGLQLPEYLLLTVLAFAIHVVVNDKYVGLLVGLVAYLLIVLAPWLGVEHKLLVYGAGPSWDYTEMRGFGASLGPWLWFKLYWVGWAVLLAVVARVCWVRGTDSALRQRIRVATRRTTAPGTAGPAGAALAAVLVLGGFVFYNTNVLNEHVTEDERVRRRAEYERRYGVYEGIPQPHKTATELRIEIHPDRGSAVIEGSYRLVNRDSAPIEAVHLEPAFYVDTEVTFDPAVGQVVADDELGHHIYPLQEPLQPGDSLTVGFEVRMGPRGFDNDGATTPVVENGTHFTAGALPVVGYQPLRELWSAEDRRRHGLPRQVTLPPPSDIDPLAVASAPATFEAVIGTDADQVAVAPGELRDTWTEGGRRYFRYVSEVPLTGTELFFSAAYEVHRARWRDVDVMVLLHPEHARHADRFLRAVQASLSHFSEQFGPYPYGFLTLVEQPGNFRGMGVDGSGVITGGEGMFLFDPEDDGFDGIFEIVAHEMGHQWWGVQLKPAFAEGGGVISESLAWYSGMRLVQEVKGREALRRFMSFMRQPNPWPPIRTGRPLLRAMDPWANYRKGPYAMYALSEYVGADRVNGALRTLIDTEASSLATTLDLYRELQAVTPDSLRPLLHDLFEVNTLWRFDTRRAVAARTADGSWSVTFDVEALKVEVDSAGRETERPVSERIELGVFAPAEPGEALGRPLYLRRHPIRSGSQTITVIVPERPARGGIDPYNLLDWEEGDNIEPVEIPEPG